MATNPLVLPMLRAVLPPWWSRQVTDAQLTDYARRIRQELEGARLFGTPETTPLLLRRLDALRGDLAWFGGESTDVAGQPVPRNGAAERAVLCQLLGICLARLAAPEALP